MVTRLNIAIALMCVIALSSCGKFICSDVDNYNFQINMQAYPSKDSIHINDTLYVEANSPTTFTDTRSGAQINFSNAENLEMYITLYHPQAVNNDSGGAVKDVTINILNGTFLSYSKNPDPSIYSYYSYQEISGFYKLKLAIIPKRLGNYAIGISNSDAVYTKGKPCSKAGFEIDFANTDQHLYFINFWVPGTVIDNLNRQKVYYFKVY